MPFSNLYKAGKYTLDIRLKADDGYAIDSAIDITIDGKDVKLTGASMWESLGDIYVEAELQKDELHGKAPSLWSRILSALSNFFSRIRYFFAKIFGIRQPV